MRTSTLCLAVLLAGAAHAVTRHVSTNGTHTSPFTTWVTAATNIHAAVAVAVDGDIVMVTNGTYRLAAEVALTNATISLQSVNGAAATILDGRRACRVLRLGRGSVATGFTVSNGYAADFGSGASVQQGTLSNCIVVANVGEVAAGLMINNDGIVDACVIRDNVASNAGGGAVVSERGVVRNSLVFNNSVPGFGTQSNLFYGGGGILLVGGVVENCVVSNNATANQGGGIYLWTKSVLDRCTIEANTAARGGGGIFCDNGGFVQSCIVRANASTNGGGVYCLTNGLLQNCTIVDNVATNGGGVFLVGGGSNVNSVVYFNQAVAGANYAALGTGARMAFCTVTPAPVGALNVGGNDTTAPAFIDYAGGDLHMSNSSACVDSGTNCAAIFLLRERDGKPRVANGVVDRGAFEIGPAAPFLNVTSMPAVVSYDVASFTVAGTCTPLVAGDVLVSNALNGFTTSLPATQAWTVAAIPLAVGANVISARGTNLDLFVTADSVTVVRLGAGTGTPKVAITNGNAFVIYDVTEYVLGGTNNVHVVGGMRVTNQATGAAFPFDASAGGFAVQMSLALGTNTIIISGTNMLGTTGSATTQVVRGGAGTSTPWLDLTSTFVSVNFDIGARAVAGVANMHVVGGMWASNTLNDAVVEFAATNAWVSPPVPLAAGTNTLVVRGTNAFGVITNDAVLVVRSPAATGTPFVNITSEVVSVSYAVSSLQVAGTNNECVVGGMRVHNPASGYSINIPASKNWTTPPVSLVVGFNDIYVYGTNGYGAQTYGLLIVARNGEGTGTPAMDITTTPTTVTFDTAVFSAAGTNNDNVIGNMVVSNEANGSMATFPAVPAWVAPALPLVIGSNRFFVNGANAVGVGVTDSVVIVRGSAGSGTPRIGLANAPTQVVYDVTSFVCIGTNNANVAGGMWVSNAANAAAATFAAATPWTAPALPLAVGQNIMWVGGTNAIGNVGVATATVVRLGAGTGIPLVDITTTPVTVSIDVSSYTIAGTNNVNVVGGMWVSNAANGYAASRAAATAWSMIGVPLELDINDVYVWGTNVYGVASTDTVAITRGVPGSGIPVIDMGSTNATVTFDVIQFRAAGWINRNVMGSMWISNALNGIVSNFLAVSPWLSAPIDIDAGTNVFVVYGTNLLNQATNAAVTIIRGPQGSGMPLLNVTSTPATVSYMVLSKAIAGIAGVNVVGDMWVSNAANGAVAAFPAALGWTSASLPLEPYDNTIHAYGTNLYGVLVSDNVTITRAPPASATNYVAHTGGHAWPYVTWATAATNVADAVRAAMHGNLVLVDTGVFMLASRVEVSRPVTVRGVMGADYTAVIMAGLASQRCFWLSNGVLDGLTISNQSVVVTTITVTNDVTVTNTYLDWWGGGVHIQRNGEVRNCIVAGNGSTNHGGGVYCYHGGSVINSVVANNRASWNGGGVYGINGGTVADSTVSGNTATNGGGAYLIVSGSVARCIMNGNTARKNGGAVYLQFGASVEKTIMRDNVADYGGAVYLQTGGTALNCLMQRNTTRYRGTLYCYYGGLARNCDISANTADYGGGIFFEAGGTAQNCTIAGNDAVTSGGGVYCINGGVCVNCILHGNNGLETGTTNFIAVGANISFAYCATMPAVSGVIDGGGNTAADPLFVDPAIGDFHVLAGSPCIDAGTNMDWMAAATDLDGVARIIDASVNIGCYELFRSGNMPAPGIVAPVAIAPGTRGIYYTTNLLLSSLVIDGTKVANTWVMLQNTLEQWITNGVGQAVGDTTWSNRATVSVNGRTTTLSFRGANSDLLDLSTNVTVIEIRYAGMPAVDITSAPAIVMYDTAMIAVAGSNSAYAGGTMWLSNTLNGAVVQFPAAPSWTSAEIGLNVGVNLLTVYTTNRFGYLATDTVAITRYGPGTGFPFVDVLDTNATVTFDGTTASPAGTNNVNVVGDMWVSNAANAAVSPFAATQTWTAAPVPLIVGTNVLHVCGTNVYGYVTNDTVRILRGIPGTGIPFVASTNQPGFVTFDDTTFAAAGTNNPNVVGTMWASNITTSTRVAFPAAVGWTAPALPLAVGSNVVTVFGTNLFGAATNNTLTVVRGVPGTGTPVLDVTNDPAWVTFDIITYAIAGFNNTNVMGGMWVSNEANGAVASFAAAAAWTTPELPLAVGTNMLRVMGTNLFGSVTNDAVAITRGAPGTGVPRLYITNQIRTVQYSATNYVVTGTNNPNVVGGMWVSNTANGAVHSFAAADGWSASIAITPPPFVATLVVYGTNAFGTLATDAIAVSLIRPAGVTNYVSLTGGNKWPYLSWGDAATDIQSAIDATELSNTVLVFDGTYPVSAPLSITNTITVKSAHGADVTVIRPVAPTHRCVSMSDGVLQGFTLAGGYATNGGAVHLDHGGTVAACVLDGNSAAKGGAAWLEHGGMLQGCIVRDNSAIETSALWLDNGGTIRSCLVHANTGNDRGTVECLLGGVVQNCTIVSNFSIAFAGVVCDQGGLVQNSILYHNSAFSGATNYFNAGAGMSYDHNCLWPAIAAPADGGANVTNDPRLVDITSDDGAFLVGSACRDTGANLPWMAAAMDVNGMPRVVNGIIDIGAYEYQSSNAVVWLTNSPAWVSFDVPAYTVGGSNNVYVVGGMWISNEANGVVAQFAAMPNWVTPPMPLAIGPNALVVHATNLYGRVANDTVVITRGAPGTGVPHLSITNQALAVPYNATNYVVAGTNDPNVVGTMWVSNTANGIVRSFAAAAGWNASIPVTPPPFAATLVVYGTNAFGVVAMDAITVLHVRPAGVTNFVALTGGNKWPFISWADAATDIQSAIDAAAPSNTVLVYDGVYSLAAPLTITTSVLVKSAHGAGATVLTPTAAVHRCAVMTDGLLEGFTFTGGYATNGGSVWLAGGGSLVACILEGNTASRGGAAWLDHGGLLDRCIVRNNAATEAGALWLDGGGTVRNSSVHGNTANDRGAIDCLMGGTIDNCTVISNANIANAGVYCDQGGTIRNSILYHNAAFTGGINYHNDGAGMAYIHNCLLPGITGSADGGDNITSDPGLLDFASGNSQFDILSPCRDAGTNLPWMADARDVMGLARIVSDIVDIGAFEYQGSNAIIRVTNDAAWVTYDVTTYAVAGTNNIFVVGGMWLSNEANGAVVPFPAASPWTTPPVLLAVGPNPLTVHGTNVYGQIAHDTVLVTRGAPGTGVPFLDITNETLAIPYQAVDFVVAGTNNPNVVGAMWVSNAANGIARSFPAAAGWTGAIPLTPPPFFATLFVYGSNAFGVVVQDAITIDLLRPSGVTNFVSLTGGNRWPYLSWSDAATGIHAAIDAAAPGNTIMVFDGTYSIPAPIVVTNYVVIRSINGAANTIMSPATPTHRCAYMTTGVLEGFTFVGGSATNGGAIHLDGGGAVVACVIEGGAAYKGGAAWLAQGGLIESCVIRHNAATETSAVWLDHGGSIRSTIIHGNVGNDRGTVECLVGGSVQNCTVVSNTGIASAGIYCDQGGIVQNSILYYNYYAGGTMNYFNAGAGMSYDHNCLLPAIAGAADGGANITVTPQLIDYAAGNPAFLLSSPCRDTGANLPWMDGALDVNLMLRVCNAIVDIGAFEFQSSNAVVGISTSPTWVSYDVLSFAVAGTNNVYVVGGMWVSNAANGATATFGAAPSWATPSLSLAVGQNTFWVIGTNRFGTAAADSVVITRGAPGTGVPRLAITNETRIAAHDATTFVVAGTNNPNVVGSMWVSNAANGTVTVFLATHAWAAAVSIVPPVFESTLVVYGTNAFGVVASDSMILSRTKPPGVTNYVARTGGHVWPFLTWGEAATNIQAAVDASAPSNMVLVYDGTYPGAELVIAKDITVVSLHGKGSTVILPASPTYRCVTISAGILDGFTISNGHDTAGGGVLFAGGGTVRNCSLLGNFATKGGAARFVGGGLLDASLVRANFATESSALWFDQGGIARNCSISGNLGNDRGAVECLRGGTLQNCTIVSNMSIALPGIVCDNGGLLQNCIVYDNGGFTDTTNHFDIGTGMSYQHCSTYPAITGPADGGGNFTANPRIANISRGNPTFQVGSPCRDTGTNLPWMAGAGDYFGAPRIANGIADIGAFEYQSIGTCTVKVCKVTATMFSLTLEPFPDVATNHLDRFVSHYFHVRMADAAEGALGQAYRIERDSLWWLVSPATAQSIDPGTGLRIPVATASAKLVSTNEKFQVKYVAKKRSLTIKCSTSKKTGINYQTLIGHPFDTIRIVVVIDDLGKEVIIPLDKKGSYKAPKP